MNRREHLLGLAGVTGSALIGLPGAAYAEARSLPAAADTSQLIYISPIKRDGGESRCQAEVWFLRYEVGLYVVTAVDAWRARAVKAGLTQAKVWVGDVGVWTRNEEYRELPALMAQATLIADARTHTAVLGKMGGKYPDEWDTWGPRFKEGLADGSRVMLRYQVA